MIHRQVLAIYHCSEAIHDPCIFESGKSNDLYTKFPNHVNICLSLHDMRYISFSLLLNSVGFFMIIELSRDFQINLCKEYSTLTTSIHLAIGYKMFFVSIPRQYIQSLWSGSVLVVYRWCAVIWSCELAGIFYIGMRYLGKVMQSM